MDEAKQAIVKLFQCYNSTGSETERKLKLNAYWEVLGQLPPATVVSVCRKASRGEIGNPGFLPTAAELYQAACKWGTFRPRAYPKLAEPHHIMSQDEREQIHRGLKGLRDELNASNEQPKVTGWRTLGGFE